MRSYCRDYDPSQVGNIQGNRYSFHDKALIRAHNSKYRLESMHKEITRDPEKTLFLGNLDKLLTEADVRKMCEIFGSIVHVRVVRDIITLLSRGYAFVEFEKRESCFKAYTKLHGTSFKNRRILVDFERERIMPNWKPRRLGGGFGGNIKSGQVRFGCRTKPFKVMRKASPQNAHELCWKRGKRLA